MPASGQVCVAIEVALRIAGAPVRSDELPVKVQATAIPGAVIPAHGCVRAKAVDTRVVDVEIATSPLGPRVPLLVVGERRGVPAARCCTTIVECRICPCYVCCGPVFEVRAVVPREIDPAGDVHCLALGGIGSAHGIEVGHAVDGCRVDPAACDVVGSLVDENSLVALLGRAVDVDVVEGAHR